MEIHTLPNCTISGIETTCYKLCKTCAPNSHCGNPYACTSCFPGDNKISENINDPVFKCSDVCDVIRIRLDDGTYFCPSVENATAELISETSEPTAFIQAFTTNVEPLISFSSADGKHVIVIVVVIAGIVIIVVIVMWLSRRNMTALNESRNGELQEIKIKNRKTNNPPTARKNVPVAAANELKPLITVLPFARNASLQTNSSLEVIMNKDFEKGQLIGGGNYSRVFEGTLRGEPVAIKVALKEGKKNIYKELQVYEKVTHPSIVEALGVHLSIENMLFLKIRKYNLAKYFLDYGNIVHFLQLKQYCIQVADGMKYLHNRKILHGDLKIDNILVKDDNGEFVEISDFGSAVDLTNDHEPKFNGTVTHTAYELLKKILDSKYLAKPSKASDVWAYAVTAWQIFQKNDRIPNDFLKPKEIIINYEKGRKLPTPAIVTEKFWRYIFYQCFDLDPQSRPTMNELYKNLINFCEDSPSSSNFTI